MQLYISEGVIAKGERILSTCCTACLWQGAFSSLVGYLLPLYIGNGQLKK